jgi:hypothetical protein
MTQRGGPAFNLFSQIRRQLSARLLLDSIDEDGLEAFVNFFGGGR